ncbi:MAG TPA: tetratricopeptide repeat protein [Pyrinomonadaceae bacterium]|nr:tetratricopeptide repeat protein [Pyrinomonadaceae bacterium]HEU4837666.1 tetratricopeptide repeat protein [Pyrinomonadaceae bacterium]
MTRRQRLFPIIAFTLALNTIVFAQATSTPKEAIVPSGRIFTLYGDLAVIELDADAGVPANTMFDLILYSRESRVNDEVARQRVGKGGRYSFNNIVEGNYLIGVELDNVEIARVAIHVAQRKHKPIEQGMELSWDSSLRAKREFVIARESYSRNDPHRKLFDKAMKQINDNELTKAVATLRSIVEADPKDHQTWNELGLVYFVQKDFNAAENSFAKAIDVKPEYVTAFVNLGRVRLAQKKIEGAIAAFQSGLQKDPKSAVANYFMGEAYFAARKAAIAVEYMNEALKLDPVAMANAHLRIAMVYNVAGRKDLAAIEYNEFLKKKPEYPDAQRLRDYIIANNPRNKRSSEPSPSRNP